MQVVAHAGTAGLGPFLTQIHKDGLRIISYTSTSVTETEQRYSQTENEVFALIRVCEKFHPFIYRTLFKLVTDHKPLG